MSGPTPLDADLAARLAALARAGITREYPHKPGEVWTGPDDVLSPRRRHPAFYGCFDWHSAVHGHWTLVRLLRLCPAWRDGRDEARSALERNLTAEHLRDEARLFEDAAQRGFERPYGWAWLLRLAQELGAWRDERAARWAAWLEPLAATLAAQAAAWLRGMARPLRSGQHADTAFALAFFLDAARARGDAVLEAACVDAARRWYEPDRDYPLRYEPSGHDFFSPGLNEADLMRRVLRPVRFAAWLDDFLPGLARGDLGPLATPEAVVDPADGKHVHLAGLALTRAWTLRGVAAALASRDARRALLEGAAAAHAEHGLRHVSSGHYAGEHWLATFAVHLLTLDLA